MTLDNSAIVRGVDTILDMGTALLVICVVLWALGFCVGMMKRGRL